jgi:hypothetical protein
METLGNYVGYTETTAANNTQSCLPTEKRRGGRSLMV